MPVSGEEEGLLRRDKPTRTGQPFLGGCGCYASLLRWDLLIPSNRGTALWSQWANPLAEVEGKEPRTTEAGIRWSHLKGNKNKSKSNKQWKGSGLKRPCQANSGKPRGERIFSEFPKVFVVLWPLHSQAVSMAFTERESSVMMFLPFPFGTTFSASWNKSLASMGLFKRQWVGRHGRYILARPDFSQRETL